jgi:hypothetical protein
MVWRLLLHYFRRMSMDCVWLEEETKSLAMKMMATINRTAKLSENEYQEGKGGRRASRAMLVGRIMVLHYNTGQECTGFI